MIWTCPFITFHESVLLWEVLTIDYPRESIAESIQIGRAQNDSIRGKMSDVRRERIQTTAHQRVFRQSVSRKPMESSCDVQKMQRDWRTKSKGIT